MKNYLFRCILLTVFLFACEFEKSVKMDFITGLKASGDGLSCTDVYLTSNGNKLNTTTFIYGEKFKVNFENINGFIKQENFALPGMEFIITSVKGDTLMYNADLYNSNAKGFDLSPLLLLAEVTTGEPLNSGATYNLDLNIWDKHGEGTFSAKLDFEVIVNPKITVEKKDLTYKEIYLYSDKSKSVLHNNKSRYNEEVYLLMEGLDGFTNEDGLAYIGVKMKATDANNTILLDEADLIGTAPLNISELKDQLAPNFIFQNTNIENPVACEVVVWDKKGDGHIKTTFNLILE